MSRSRPAAILFLRVSMSPGHGIRFHGADRADDEHGSFVSLFSQHPADPSTMPEQTALRRDRSLQNTRCGSASGRHSGCATGASSGTGEVIQSQDPHLGYRTRCRAGAAEPHLATGARRPVETPVHWRDDGEMDDVRHLTEPPNHPVACAWSWMPGRAARYGESEMPPADKSCLQPNSTCPRSMNVQYGKQEGVSGHRSLYSISSGMTQGEQADEVERWACSVVSVPWPLTSTSRWPHLLKSRCSRSPRSGCLWTS
nr:hypothetical protein CFP56_21716 [Quercus suber]